MFPFIKPHCKFFSSYFPPPILIKHLGMCLALLLINAQRVILFLPNLISLLLVNNIVIYQPGNFKKWVNLTYDSDTCSEVLDVVGLGWEVESEMNSQTLKFSLSEIVELGGVLSSCGLWGCLPASQKLSCYRVTTCPGLLKEFQFIPVIPATSTDSVPFYQSKCHSLERQDSGETRLEILKGQIFHFIASTPPVPSL